MPQILLKSLLKDSWFKIKFESDDQMREFGEWLLLEVAEPEPYKEMSEDDIPF